MSDAESAGPPQRGEVWHRLGEPDDQLGSVNDPRTHQENGLTWNEKWVYVRDGVPDRVVLWNRYDFVGSFRVAEDGSFEPDPLDGP
jgi:hypothetical protein